MMGVGQVHCCCLPDGSRPGALLMCCLPDGSRPGGLLTRAAEDGGFRGAAGGEDWTRAAPDQPDAERAPAERAPSQLEAERARPGRGGDGFRCGIAELCAPAIERSWTWREDGGRKRSWVARARAGAPASSCADCGQIARGGS
jgi:hypothetical protein